MTDTSREARRSVEPYLATMFSQILDVLQERGAAGMTCEEIEQRFGWKHQSASARLHDIRLDHNVRDSGLRRPTTSGRNAIVWVLNGV